jgi:hypothetical protein
MAKRHEFHEKYSNLPATGLRAIQLNERYYFTGKRCTKNHLSPRYATSGNCIQCIAEKRGQASIIKKERFVKRNKENLEKTMLAIENGLIKYESTTECPQGHYLRFVSSNNCCECSFVSQEKRKERTRWLRIKKEYGLSEQEVKNMLFVQKNLCQICELDITKNYHIDHCHKTNKVRSLLCQKCNQAIGLLKESEYLFDKATQYIRQHNEIEKLSRKIIK